MAILTCPRLATAVCENLDGDENAKERQKHRETEREKSSLYNDDYEEPGSRDKRANAELLTIERETRWSLA